MKDAAVFSNYLGFKEQTTSVPLAANWIIDVEKLHLIDHTFCLTNSLKLLCLFKNNCDNIYKLENKFNKS